MISVKDRVIFIHIPKTSGTSIECMFGCRTIRDSSSGIRIIDNQNIVPVHMSAIEMQEAHPIWFNNFYKFTIVRNSWDRIFSAYMMGYNSRSRAGMPMLTFEDFLQKINNKNWRDQLSYITINGKIVMDQVIRFEDLQNEWSQLCQTIGKSYEPMVHVLKNQNKSITLHDVYTPNNIKLVAQMCKKEIEYFNYDFPSKTTS